jgi:hypothetical protein
MSVIDLQDVAANLPRCSCGHEPVILRHRGKYLITCPDLRGCAEAPMVDGYHSLKEAKEAWRKVRGEAND